MNDDTLIAFGGEIKALDDGRVGGYLVRFTGPDAPDLEGDFFTKATDFDFDDERPLSVYYHHGQDKTLKNAKLGKGVARKDDVGVWLEAQLDLADEYTAAVLRMIEAGKVGWSSGAVAHLVTREQKGAAWHITSWPIGEASITPTPAAGPRMTQVTTLKALIPEAAQDTATDEEPTGEKTTEHTKGASRAPEKGENMSDEKKEAPPIVDRTADILAAIERMEQERKDEMKAMADRLATIEKTPVNMPAKAAAVIRQRGDGFAPSFKNWVKTGSDDGLKSLINDNEITLPANLNAAIKASNDTDMNVGTDADGGYAVPTGMVPDILAKRDETALVSRLPLTPIPGVGTTVNYPIDNEADGEFITKAEATAYDRDAPALSEKAFTLVKYTKTIQVSDELMADTPTNLMGFLSDFVGRGMAKTDNNLLLTEIASNGTALDTFASATAIAFGEPETIVSNDDLAPYLEDESGVAWVMRTSVLWEIMSLVGENRYYGGGVDLNADVRKLLGYPVYHSGKAGATTASAKSVYFGNWRFVGVRYGPGLTFLRNPYLLANSGQVALHFYYRVAFGVLQAEAIGYGAHPSA